MVQLIISKIKDLFNMLLFQWQPLYLSILKKNIITNILVHVPKRGFAHQPLNGDQPRDLFGGNAPKGKPPKGPPFNPHFGSCGWPEPNPCIFIPPWYPMLTTQPIPKPITKLYKKL